MRHATCRLLFAAMLAWGAAGAASAGTVTGEVRNGTNGTPAPGLDVILFQLQGGMQPVANTKSDSQGRFQFDRPEIGAQPMLIRVIYRGVNYHQPLPPGTPTVKIEVFEPTEDPTTVQIANRAIIFQPSGANLLIGEEYTVENHTHPPVAYFEAGGTFEFSLPEGAQLNQVSAWSAAGMPVVQGTTDKGKNRSAIAFPFRPGENGVRLSYQLAYPSNQATLQIASPYAARRVLLVVPPTVQVTSAGFESAGQQQGWNIYARENIPAATKLDISVSGTAPSPSSGESADSSVNSRAESTAGENARPMPGRLEDLKWIVVGGFAGLFVLGALFLWQRSKRGASAGLPHDSGDEVGALAIAEVHGKVHGSLDEIKENLFRLEIRRQAGTISEEEYARQRGRAEKILRDLVKG